MILDNPMKDKEIARKNGLARRGKLPKNPFPKGNQFSKLRKDFRHTDLTRTIISMKNLGKRSSDLQKEIAWKNAYTKNPMWRPEVREIQKQTRNVNKLKRNSSQIAVSYEK